MTTSVKTYPLFSELYQSTMYQHKLPNGNIIMHEGLPKDLAIKRMEDEERWMKEHREELEVSSQQLFDDMFGG
jgi:hypothetical protein